MPKRRKLQPDSVYSRQALETWLTDTVETKASHRNRIWKHFRGDIHKVPDIPKAVIKNFNAEFVSTTSRVVEEKSSEHGRKLVVKLQDGHLIETVIIKHTPSRSTVCVSSQVGCQMACTFCATGTLGKIAQLTDAEIVEQVYHARQCDSNVSGVVFMGMGEPLDNYTSVIEAIHSLSDPAVFNENPIPLRRITLSTVGVVHGITRLARECPQIQLALSLHAPNDVIRQQIVPTTRAFSISKIMAAVDKYQQAGGRSVMIEYIMIANVNSSTKCAHELGTLLQKKRCMINLIPYNQTDAGDAHGFQAPSDRRMEEFAKILYQYRNDRNKPLRCCIRWSSQRGKELDAACGQLALKNIQSNNNSSAARSKDIEDISCESHIRRVGEKLSNGVKGKSSKSRTGKKEYNASRPVLPNHWCLVLTGVVVLGGVLLLRKKRPA